MRTGRATIVIVFLLCQPALAHSFYISPSTPVSPPIGYGWLATATLGLLLLANILLLRLLRIVRWRAAIRMGIAIVVGFVIFFFLGDVPSSTAPPPGLGAPNPVFWGYGWPKVGEIFLWWNFRGVLVLMCVCTGVLVSLFFGPRAKWHMLIALVIGVVYVCWSEAPGEQCLVPVFAYQVARLWKCPPKRRGQCRLLLLTNMGLYIVGILPYIATGALSHGKGGSYVTSGCDERIATIAKALFAYADRHDGNLPSASSLGELMPKIEPYINTKSLRYSSPVTVCPLGAAYDRHPRPYEWNPRYSNTPASKIPDFPDSESEVLLQCPYHKWAGEHAQRWFRQIKKESLSPGE